MPRKNRGLQVWYRAERACWEVGEYEHGKRKRHTTGLRSREEAQTRLAELITGATPAGPVEFVGEAMAYYLEHHAPTTARPDLLFHFSKVLAPFWGDLRIKDVNKGLCQQYAEQRQREFKRKQEEDQSKRPVQRRKAIRALSNATLRRELGHLHTCLNFAFEEGLSSIPPRIWKPANAPPRSRWLTYREAAHLLRQARQLPIASDYLPLFILVALYTGARKEAVLTLRWSQIDLEREYIDFRAGQQSARKGRGIVPIPRRLLRELKRLRRRGSTDGFVIQHNQKPLGDIKKGFKEACVRAKLEKVTPHTLRHTTASWMVQKGVPLFEVARYLGHSSTAMVERTYGHMAPEHLKRAKDSWG